jgi:murein L,D-transpeptidase YcbB/YkuD
MPVLCASLATGVRADQLGEQLRERIEQLRDAAAHDARARPLNDAVAGFYERRSFAPAWTGQARQEQLLSALGDMSADGLNPEDYGLSALAAARTRQFDSMQAHADFDLRATQAYLHALRDLYRGKVEPRSLDPAWSIAPRELDLPEALSRATAALDAERVSEAFAAARPQHPIYAALRQALLKLREVQARGGWPQLPPGTRLKSGMHDPRVSLLRRRLALGGYLPAEAAEGEDYDPVLEDAVRQFQTEQYLAADGRVGEKTRLALDVPVEQRIGQLRVNLERARWLLHEVQGDLVLIDIAGYRTHYYKGAAPVWSARVQVGQPYRRTPSFKSEIRYLTFNPSWTVPPTVLKQDMLPKIRKDPRYLEKNHIRVFDLQGREIPVQRVDWSRTDGVRLRQDPGPDNAIGRIVIRFPNPYSIYLHETPHGELFAQQTRAFSSGCIRVERPFELAELLLDDPQEWSAEAIARAVDGGETKTVYLRHPVPIVVFYWTVDLHQGMRLSYKPDIYALDPPVLAALDRQAQAH